MFKKSNRKAFTLIELLVVIAIIGVLASIVLVSLNSAREKARDVKRIGDIRQVALALELYYDGEGAYPGDTDASDCDDWTTMATALAAEGAMSAAPSEPGSQAAYAYESDADEQGFILRVQLEDTGHSALDGDVDGTVNGCVCTDGTDGYYCIQP